MYKGQRKHQSAADTNVLKGGLTPTPERRRNQVEESINRLPKEGAQKDAFITSSVHHPRTKQPLMTLAPSIKLPKWDVTPGLLGICNHGNTCFMNTILQCLNCTDLFAEYFVQKKYKESQNGKSLTKKLVGSYKAEVCEEIGRLFESLWSGSYSSEISNHLKNILSKHNSQYKGSSQHDAQEFLLWLLDRLNEELHFSSKKKLKDIQQKAKKEKQNEVIALSSPETVLAASSGFEIYNRFQALYKSSLICPDCGNESNTYESYLCLSLPVPQKNTRPVYVTVVYLDDSPKQLKIALEMNVMDTIRDLREKLAHELYVTPGRLVLCQVSELGFGNTFGDDQPLSDIHESENVYVFETYPFSEVNKTPDLDLLQILLVHVEKISSTKCYRFCSPEVIKVSRDIEFLRLQRYILRSMKLAVSERVVEENYSRALFDIRVVDSGIKDMYLPTEVDMPLYTEPIDSALATYKNDEYGPAHVKFVIEWEPSTKSRLVSDDEDHVEEHQSVHKARLGQQQTTNVSLQECLQLFTKEEKLEEGEKWQCPRCQKHQEGAIKKLGLWSAPDILVIHLKRFRHCGLKRNKLNTLVNFPISDLEMGHHLVPTDGQKAPLSDLYDLYAVSNHYGNMSAGHYTAFCKNPVDMKWYEFDDTMVKPIHQRDIVTKAAYLLFYQRKKLTNNTINSLQSKQHWVYAVSGPPRSMQTVSSSPMEENKTVVNSPSRDRNYSEYYVDRVRLDNVDDRHKISEASREKSATLSSKVESMQLKQEEEKLLEELRQEVNSPRSDHQKPKATSDTPFDRDVHYPMRVNLDINSPRREEYGISSPRQSVKQAARDSPRKELFPDQIQTLVSSNLYLDSERKTAGKTRPSVAEQVLQSKMPVDGIDNVTLSPRNMSNVYRRSDSVDSSKNSHSYTSGSEISPNGSAPPSPLDEVKQTAASNSAKQGNLLNNERDVNILNGNVSNSVKLKIHSNQIHGRTSSSRSSNSDNKNQSGNPYKTGNQKVNNSSNADMASQRPDVFSTPQQVRKSPSPPGRTWSTPQPSRKQYSGSKAPVDRQYSVPPRNTGQNTHRLEIEGHAVFDNQPRSLPVETRTSADKPPLPVKPNRPSTANSINPANTSRSVPVRPTTAHVVSDYIDSRPYHVSDTQSAVVHSREPSYSDSRPVYVTENQSAGGHSREGFYSDSRPVLVEERVDNQTSRGRSNPDPDRFTRGEVRPRNRSADRHDNRSMRVRTERPVSYHQAQPNDLDHYYLAQPVDDEKTFERSRRYATMLPQRHDQPVKLYDDTDYLRSQVVEPRAAGTLFEQPRSRAPFGTYNPHLYQDHSHYQPHMHQAKMLSKMALHENRNLQRKTKAEYLKESSV